MLTAVLEPGSVLAIANITLRTLAAHVVEPNDALATTKVGNSSSALGETESLAKSDSVLFVESVAADGTPLVLKQGLQAATLVGAVHEPHGACVTLRTKILSGLPHAADAGFALRAEDADDALRAGRSSEAGHASRSFRSKRSLRNR